MSEPKTAKPSTDEIFLRLALRDVVRMVDQLQTDLPLARNYITLASRKKLEAARFLSLQNGAAGVAPQAKCEHCGEDLFCDCRFEDPLLGKSAESVTKGSVA